MFNDSGGVAMKLDYDIEKLQEVADDFYQATGIGIFIIGEDFSDVKAKSTKWNPYCDMIRSVPGGRERCKSSDDELLHKCRESKKPEMHICHGGLVNIAAPIMYEETVIGYIFFFSLRQGEFSDAISSLTDLHIDVKEMEKHYSHVPIYNERRFKSVINLAVMLAQHVILAKMIKPGADENLQRVKNYIRENLGSDLSVKAISKGTNISKSVLYRLLNKYFKCTLSEYVNRKRIEEADRLLLSTELPVAEISERVGFSSTVHFRSTFKKIKGTTPLTYRKQNRGR
jgi:AraC-like DNA-binding protein